MLSALSPSDILHFLQTDSVNFPFHSWSFNEKRIIVSNRLHSVFEQFNVRPWRFRPVHITQKSYHVDTIGCYDQAALNYECHKTMRTLLHHCLIFRALLRRRTCVYARHREQSISRPTYSWRLETDLTKRTVTDIRGWILYCFCRPACFNDLVTATSVMQNCATPKDVDVFQWQIRFYSYKKIPVEQFKTWRNCIARDWHFK